MMGIRSLILSLPRGEILGITGLDGQGQDNFVKALSWNR